jgi:uncharacterized protein YjbI with pentapeptide repeats
VDLTFAAAVLVTLAVGWVAVLWLLEQAEKAPAEDRATLQAEAVKSGATIALGTGGAAYLLLAYRRQRLEEIDTRERRITELFTKAVEELGHDKAPVRLGALYSLERLAQNNLEHRQTVVDVICAYLRMPYTLPARSKPGAEGLEEAVPPAEDRDRAPHPVPGQDPAEEELQVRQTAQGILVAHLRLPEGNFTATARTWRPSPWQGFWPNISLDLTGATFYDVDFKDVLGLRARFMQTTFQNLALFIGARFDLALFIGAAFRGLAWFDVATFQGLTTFERATFRFARFEKATFQDLLGVQFNEATFQGDARFDRATFQGYSARFDGATFQGDARFDGATFQGLTTFEGATFQGGAVFEGATFQGGATFEGATFQGGAVFEGATFQGGAVFFDRARVLHVDNPDFNKRRVWPDGWSVRPDPAHPSHGTLVRARQAEEAESVVPPVRPDRR